MKKYEYRVVTNSDRILEEGTLECTDRNSFDGIINRYYKENVYYTRMWLQDNGWNCMDFGSHTVFIEYREIY